MKYGARSPFFFSQLCDIHNIWFESGDCDVRPAHEREKHQKEERKKASNKYRMIYYGVIDKAIEMRRAKLETEYNCVCIRLQHTLAIREGSREEEEKQIILGFSQSSLFIPRSFMAFSNKRHSNNKTVNDTRQKKYVDNTILLILDVRAKLYACRPIKLS